MLTDWLVNNVPHLVALAALPFDLKTHERYFATIGWVLCREDWYPETCYEIHFPQVGRRLVAVYEESETGLGIGLYALTGCSGIDDYYAATDAEFDNAFHRTLNTIGPLFRIAPTIGGYRSQLGGGTHNFACWDFPETFAVVLAGCGQQGGSTPPPLSRNATGMSDFTYLACDGGPHLVLPKELSRRWQGAGSALAALSPSSDYGRACAAVAQQDMALISVGSGQAMALADPPLSAWGRSPEGWVDIYRLGAWPDTNIDAMVRRAVAATPTSGMTDTGKVMTLAEPGLILLFAGDRPGSTAYGEHAIPIGPGRYRILEGHYQTGAPEDVHVLRLRPADVGG